MCEHDTELKTLIASAAMKAGPDTDHMDAVRDRLAGIAHSADVRHRRYMTACVAAVVLVTLSAFGVATTEAGRSFVRWIFTPVEPSYVITGEHKDGEGSWVVGLVGSGATPPTVEEEQQWRRRMAEYEQIRKAGGGRMAGLLEGPGDTIYSIEYTLTDGEIHTVGEGRPTGKQAANMRIDEIMELRDAGAGEIISEHPFQIGLGRYTIRFTLADGETVDIVTNYPPRPREEREAIFKETRQLKKLRRFSVMNPSSSPSRNDVWGVLRYTLADGRVVGITEKVPRDVLTPDGKHVMTQETETSDQEKPLSHHYEVPDEVKKQMEAGEGQLVFLTDVPHFNGPGMLRVYKVEYTLINGETSKVNTSRLTEAQKANMRIDEILALYDAGEGELIAEEPAERGLGLFTIRYTFADGQQVDLQTYFPPNKRAEREAIFAEVRELKKALKFSVFEPRRGAFGPVYAILRYTLSDGRTVGLPGSVPAELISDDGTSVVDPQTGKTVPIGNHEENE